MKRYARTRKKGEQHTGVIIPDISKDVIGTRRDNLSVSVASNQRLVDGVYTEMNVYVLDVLNVFLTSMP